MSRRDWLLHIAIVGGIALGLALFLIVFDLAGRGYFAPSHQKSAIGLRSDCNDDLCQQMRMADAAERATAYAGTQIWLGTGSLILLAIATYFTGRAARYAKLAADEARRGADAGIVAAKAAQDTVDETRRIGEAQVRAYLSWSGANVGVGVDRSSNFVGFTFVPRVKNTGQSPASLIALYSHLELLEVGKSPEVFFDPVGTACNDIIGSGNPFEFMGQSLSKEDARAVFSRERRCYLLGWGAYRDVFSRDEDPNRTLTFCFEVSIRTPPEFWTNEFFGKHPATGAISLTSNPVYTIRPRGHDI
jgi:hypothetical protein